MRMRGGAGTSLLEVTMVMAVLGILLSIAVPPTRRFVVRTRVRGAAMKVRSDLHWARMLGIRTGAGAVVRFLPDADCHGSSRHTGHAYTVAARGGGPGAPPASLRTLDGHVCFEVNGSDSLVFNSRGLLVSFNNRTIRTVEDGERDSVTVSVAGRILKRGF